MHIIFNILRSLYIYIYIGAVIESVLNASFCRINNLNYFDILKIIYFLLCQLFLLFTEKKSPVSL